MNGSATNEAFEQINSDGVLIRIRCSFEGICKPEDFVELSKALVSGLKFEAIE
jgi:hypothetical protein